jgi:hypothetical protein
MQVKIETRPPNLMQRDLGNKLVEDLQSLIMRSLDLMGTADGVGKEAAVNITLSCLALVGIGLVNGCGGEKGTFTAMVAAAEGYLAKRRR